MPGPAIYVVAVITGVVAGLAFKEFVYDPHIAPKLQRWWEDQTTQRQIRRRRRNPVPVPTESDNPTTSERRESTIGSPVELRDLVSQEVGEWRDNVPAHPLSSTIRQRHPAAVIDESIPSIQYPLLPPTRAFSPNYTLGSSPELGSSPGNLELPLASRSPSVAALPIINLTSFASDMDLAPSIYQTPATEATTLPSSPLSPQVVVVSPFSDPLSLSRSQSRRSDDALLSPAASEADDVLSFRSGLSSPVPSSLSSVTEGDSDLDDAGDDSWDEIENDTHRH